MTKQEEKLYLKYTFWVYFISIAIMSLIIIGFILIPRTTVRSFIFFISYVLGIINLIILAKRHKIKKNRLSYSIYISLIAIFGIVTTAYLFYNLEIFREGFINILNRLKG